MIKKKYGGTHAGLVQQFEEKLAGEKTILSALRLSSGHGKTSEAQPKGNPDPSTAAGRTLATPDWAGATVLDVERKVDLEVTPLDEFNAGTQTLGCTS